MATESLQNCPLNQVVCDYPKLSLRYYEHNYTDPTDTSRKKFMDWTRQIKLCQQCTEKPEDKS